MLADLLTWLEASALGHAVRSGGVWSYALINLAHILGIATLFGSVLILDLRLLGLFARVPLPAIAAPTVRLAALGFLLAASSGACMLATNGSEYAGNPFLPVKFAAIFLGLFNLLLVHRSAAWRAAMQGRPVPRQRRQLAIAGGVSLAAWLTAITCGRMLGYW